MDEKEPHISNDLLAKYFAGEATAAELAAVEQWAVASSENREQLSQLRMLWLDTGVVVMDDAVGQSFDVDLAFAKVKAKREKALAGKAGRGSGWLLKVAASVAVLLLLGYLLKIYVFDARQLEYQAAAEIKTLQLTDGSTVTLNKQSSLSYASKFRGAKREVTLRGEAFFEVEHNPEKPFVVYAGNTTIEVLGTAFNVAMEAGQVEVLVETGRVRFSANGQEVVLSAGQQAVYEESFGIAPVGESQAVADAAQFWRTRRLVFAGNSLAEVVAALEEAFEVEIELANQELANCSLTVTFENDSLENMLDVIALTLELEVSRNGNRILLSGKGCPSR